MASCAAATVGEVSGWDEVSCSSGGRMACRWPWMAAPAGGQGVGGVDGVSNALCVHAGLFPSGLDPKLGNTAGPGRHVEVGCAAQCGTARAKPQQVQQQGIGGAPATSASAPSARSPAECTGGLMSLGIITPSSCGRTPSTTRRPSSACRGGAGAAAAGACVSERTVGWQRVGRIRGSAFAPAIKPWSLESFGPPPARGLQCRATQGGN